ncbi:thioredoxin family protein [Bailinhaonella thermotolerans]|nr:thioredoxin family protein [Bailinhaonella thermotolerans]
MSSVVLVDGDGAPWASASRVLLVFSAAWCPVGSLLRAAAEEAAASPGAVPVCLVDVDRHADLAERLRVVTVPTAILLVDGRERRRRVGAMGAADLAALSRAAGAGPAACRDRRPEGAARCP